MHQSEVFTCAEGGPSQPVLKNGISYRTYTSEAQLSDVTRLMETDLSEPYSVFTYRYFINNWPHLCWLASHGDEVVGSIVGKLEKGKSGRRRGYIAMLAVDKKMRKRGIGFGTNSIIPGSELVLLAVAQMDRDGCDEVLLETEVTNKGALALYENLGFIRDKRLYRYYLNNNDAYRLKVELTCPLQAVEDAAMEN